MIGSNETYLMRLVLALVVGGIIGLERELKGKPAGIRTNMLICFGSCLLMIASIEVARTATGPADPARLAAQVVTGIGFLGAGAIIRSRFHVSGLTTAATIWVLAALGLVIGGGYLVLAATGTLLITATLTLVRHVERALTRRRDSHILQLVLDGRSGVLGRILGAVKDGNVAREGLDVDRTGEHWIVTIEYTASTNRHVSLVERLTALDGVREITELR